MSQIEITVSQARGLILASAKGDIRYYLNGTLFDFERGRTVSTDGHVLLAVNVASAWNPAEQPLAGACIVPRDALETVAKGGKLTDTIEVTFDGETVSLRRANGFSINCEPIQGTFPAWQRAVPDKFSGEPGHFNPELVARIAKAYALAVNNPRCNVTLGYNGPTNSALVHSLGYAETALGVVMPWKVDSNPKAALAEFNAGREPVGVAA